VNERWQKAKRIVVKIGSALLVDNETGMVHRQWLSHIAEEIAQLWRQGKQIILVSSGAVALGKRHLEFGHSTFCLEKQQAAAAVGQIRLAHAYQEVMEKHGIAVAQMLLTFEDSENRQRYLNAHNTLETLLRLQVIPIINENDTVATSEIRYGDNDRLSARVAQMAVADVLVLLSDIDGLYTADPRQNSTATWIPEVQELTADIEAMGQGSGSHYGTGGMKTKLAAARMVMESGCSMVICKGQTAAPLGQLETGARCTWFLPRISPRNARKNWLAQHLQPYGSIVIDDGAANALRQGKSLLSVGVTAVTGEFRKGDAVRILSQLNQEIGRGLSNYHAHEARLIMGRRSSEFAKILGYLGNDEIIHRDDLVVLE
jgi:glutamate 5-kinase